MTSFEYGGASDGPSRWGTQGPGQPSSSYQPPAPSAAPYGAVQPYPSEGYAGQGGYPAGVPGPYPGHSPYPAGPSAQAPDRGMRLAFGIGDLLVAAGGLLYFIGSFLTWIFLDFDFGLGVDDPCADISDPDTRASCEATLGAVTNGFSANAWDLSLMSAAAVIMVLLALAAIGLGMRLLPATREWRQVLTAALVAVDVVVLTFVTTFDFSSLGSTFAEDALGDLGGAASGLGAGGLPGLALGLGFWLALAGLVAANVGMLVAQRRSRAVNPPSG